MDGSNAQFCKYFANTLKPKLTLNFKNLGNSANTWTNNNAESMHNIMKIDTNWRPHTNPKNYIILSFWRYSWVFLGFLG